MPMTDPDDLLVAADYLEQSGSNGFSEVAELLRRWHDTRPIRLSLSAEQCAEIIDSLANARDGQMIRVDNPESIREWAITDCGEETMTLLPDRTPIFVEGETDA